METKMSRKRKSEEEAEARARGKKREPEETERNHDEESKMEGIEDAQPGPGGERKMDLECADKCGGCRDEKNKNWSYGEEREEYSNSSDDFNLSEESTTSEESSSDEGGCMCGSCKNAK
ncbi:uncharacterized protein LOC129961076 isoform X1 [Argiope bruennichi]|uniref:Uncharacterized protein n=1 Tax=Argiope bruennichi TaxID=94029 RepID=A0A8T0FMI2_ARGBR|nr:uncharacterized protein LOC129961076 isoform X1 [Argiope bruennichi]XP_055930860.1 uncharacterized protein LOC129961076 isoform X1 [Argiope bruennichi]KAF8791428.1 hypothetical protein HNY73_006293 [Argiope bruennichi]